MFSQLARRTSVAPIDELPNQSIDSYVSNRAASRLGLKRRSCATLGQEKRDSTENNGNGCMRSGVGMHTNLVMQTLPSNFVGMQRGAVKIAGLPIHAGPNPVLCESASQC